MDYESWLAYGRGEGWIGEPACDTHAGVPRSDAEVEAGEQGDPCIMLVRLYPDTRE